MKKGTRGHEVVAWQRTLAALGFAPGKIDGNFGFRTEAATRAFQASRGLTADGIVGDLTRAASDAPVDTVPATALHGEVAKVGTPLTDREIVDVLSGAHEATLGTIPTHPRLICTWALVALENAHGNALWCNNFGNVSAFGGWRGEHYVIRVQERIRKDPDVWKWINMKFRAYPTPVDGASDLWRLLAGRYGAALARMDAADPTGAAYALGNAGYFTAHAGAYARTMTALYHGWR